MKIVLDAAGGDYAPHEIVKGAFKAAQEYGVGIVLVGRQNVIRKLAEKQLTGDNIEIVDATEVIDFNEHPIRAIQSKPNSSIVIGINLLKSGEADAFVSAGNTGAVVAAALLMLGKAPGVNRPAIGVFMDRISTKPSLLVDAGANADCRPEHLLEFARLGTIYSRCLLKIPSPRVGLLCNGAEEGKGNRLAKETYPMLQGAKDINFMGNIEGHDIVKRTADVIVTDGFTGNIAIKMIEGFNDSYLTSLKQLGHVFSSASRLQSSELLHDIGLNTLTRRLDYSEYGGAYLLGINGNVIIAHGRSKAKAIKNAIGLARATVERNIAEKISEGRYEQTSGNSGS